MELQFQNNAIHCLQQLKRELQYQEQTQEIRLSDGMPDIGRVLGVWGEVLVRSKEWRSGKIGASGGVMVWVLYEPEEGGAPKSIESWLPFQMKWDIPNTERDGTVLVNCILQSLDARSISARKLMIRANLGVIAEALMPGETEIPVPGAIPEDIQLLKQSYPLQLPIEAGERHFQLEEELILPASAPPIDKLIRYHLQPEVLEKAVMGGRVIFRGNCLLHILYQATSGTLHTWDFDIPYSMYSELERQYEESAAGKVVPMVTGLELDLGEDNKLNLKAGIAGQYIIYDRQNIEIISDAYSNRNNLSLKTKELQLPMVLEDTQQLVQAEVYVDNDGGNLIDTAFYPDHARVLYDSDLAEVEFTGLFQVLSDLDSGHIQNTSFRWEKSLSIPADLEASVSVTIQPSGTPIGVYGGGKLQLHGDVTANIVTTQQRGITAVTALDIGEPIAVDPNRPSLILRRAEGETLWEIAKSTGSTVEAIRNANNLSEEPAGSNILLIPIS